MADPTLHWFVVFLLSLAIEIPIVATMLRTCEPRLSRRIVAAVIATTATHPIVWFVFPNIGFRYTAMVWTSELFAWLAESAIYRVVFPKLSVDRALLTSLAANAASLVTIAALRALTGWV